MTMMHTAMGATGSCSLPETDGGLIDEEDSNPSPVNSSGSIAPSNSLSIPSGWTRVKLEPDC
jgi:hypothetical protein